MNPNVHIEFLTFKAIEKTDNSIRFTDHIDIRHFEKEVLFSYSIFMLKCMGVFQNLADQNLRTKSIQFNDMYFKIIMTM